MIKSWIDEPREIFLTWIWGSLPLTGLRYRFDRSMGLTASSRLDRSDQSSLTVSTASFWVVGIYTPWPSLARVVGSLHILEAISWSASSPQHSLWVVLNRLHIIWLGWEIECVRANWLLWELHFEQLRATIAWELLVPSKIRFAFITLGGEPPRRLGIAG